MNRFFVKSNKTQNKNKELKQFKRNCMKLS